MKFNTKSAERMLRQVQCATKSHSPEIKLVAGIAGIALSTYLFCKGAVKAEKVKQEFTEAHERVQNKYGPLPKKPETEEQKVINHGYHMEMASIYRHAAFGFFKCYIVPVGTMAGSLAMVVASHGEMRSRNAGLAAALSASQNMCNQLRNSIREKYGAQAEQELVNGITEETKVDKDGKEVMNEEKVKKWNGVAAPYCFEYSPETNANCHKYETPEYRDMFIDGKMKEMAHRLETKGMATVYQALESLGYDMTLYQDKSYVTMGWSNIGHSENDPNSVRWIIHPVQKHYEDGDREICLIEMLVDDTPVYIGNKKE